MELEANHVQELLDLADQSQSRISELEAELRRKGKAIAGLEHRLERTSDEGEVLY